MRGLGGQKLPSDLALKSDAVPTRALSEAVAAIPSAGLLPVARAT